MESWRQRRAIVDNNMHWRNPLSAVRGNHVPFSSAFAWSPAAATVEAHEPARIFSFLSRIFSPFIAHDRVQKTSLSPFPASSIEAWRARSRQTACHFFAPAFSPAISWSVAHAHDHAPGCCWTSPPLPPRGMNTHLRTREVPLSYCCPLPPAQCLFSITDNPPCLCSGRQAKRAAKPAANHAALIVGGHVQRRFGLQMKTIMLEGKIGVQWHMVH